MENKNDSGEKHQTQWKARKLWCSDCDDETNKRYVKVRAKMATIEQHGIKTEKDYVFDSYLPR